MNQMNTVRLEYIDYLIDGLSDIPFLKPMLSRDKCYSTYYVMPIRFDKCSALIKREEFVTAVNAEGAKFYQGYVKPLYLQPLYQQQILYKKGYPFEAPVNSHCKMDYKHGICPNAEKLYFDEMLINEHIRPPQSIEDIKTILTILKKIYPH